MPGGGGGGNGNARRHRRVGLAPANLQEVDGSDGGSTSADPLAAPLPLRRPRGPAVAPDAAFGQFVESRVALGKTQRTARDYGKVLYLLGQHLARRGVRDVWQVTADDLDAWLHALRTEPTARGRMRSPYTLQTYMNQVGVCFRWLADKGLVPPPVADAIRVPSIPPSERKRPKTFTNAEVETLFAHCAEGEAGDTPRGGAERAALTARNQALLAVLLDSGVRVEELVSMRAETLDWERLAVEVEKTKTVLRTVGFGVERTRSLLRRYVQYGRPWLCADEETGEPFHPAITADAGPLWLNRDGYALTVDGVRQIFTRMKRRSGLAVQVSPHVCRRYYITYQLRAGASVADVARQCGVSPEVIYRHYYEDLADERLAALRQTSPLDALAREQLARRGVGRKGRGARWVT